jgi:hypothetical protein
MKNWMNLHRTGKRKFESDFIDNARDSEGAQFFVVKLFAGACGGKIAAIQVDKSTNFERVRDWESRAIGVVGVAVELAQACHKG